MHNFKIHLFDLSIIIYKSKESRTNFNFFCVFTFKLGVALVCEEVKLRMMFERNSFGFSTIRTVRKCKKSYFQHFGQIYTFLNTIFEEKLMAESESVDFSLETFASEFLDIVDICHVSVYSPWKITSANTARSYLLFDSACLQWECLCTTGRWHCAILCESETFHTYLLFCSVIARFLQWVDAVFVSSEWKSFSSDLHLKYLWLTNVSFFSLKGYHLQNDAATRLLNTQSNSPLNQSLILPSTNQSSIGNLQSMSGKVLGNKINYCSYEY